MTTERLRIAMQTRFAIAMLCGVGLLGAMGVNAATAPASRPMVDNSAAGRMKFAACTPELPAVSDVAHVWDPEHGCWLPVP